MMRTVVDKTEFIWQPIQKQVLKRAPFIDIFDIVFSLVLIAIVLATIPLNFLSGSHAIAAVTAVTAFVGLYQLRHPTESTRPAVREAFAKRRGETVFGLQNYGPGPALYFQYFAKIGDERGVLLRPQDSPIHLSEGEFTEIEFDVESIDLMANGEIELYYSYVMEQGLREPVRLNNPSTEDSECIFKDLVEKHGDPRTINLKQVEEQLSKPSETGTETLQSMQTESNS